MIKRCINCNSNYEENFSFCPNCGQKINDQLTVSLLFHNTVSNYFSADARILRSLIPLLFRPGHIAKEFIFGRRLLYLHPAQFYLFVSVVFFFLTSFAVSDMDDAFNNEVKKMIDSKSEQGSNTIEKKDYFTVNETDMFDVSFGIVGKNDELDQSKTINESQEEKYDISLNYRDHGTKKNFLTRQLNKLYEKRGDGLIRTFFDTLPIALFLLLPIFAFILFLLFWKKAPYVHHLVFSFYFFSFLFLVLSIITLINNFIAILPSWFYILLQLLMFIYLWLSLRNFYAQTTVKSFFKTLVVVGINFLILIPFTFGFILVSAFLY